MIVQVGWSISSQKYHFYREPAVKCRGKRKRNKRTSFWPPDVKPYCTLWVCSNSNSCFAEDTGSSRTVRTGTIQT